MTLCIHGCGNKIGPNSRLNECHTCRCALYYWRKKRPAEIIARRLRLAVFGSRLDEHFDTKGVVEEKSLSLRRGNVVNLRRKRA